MNANVVPNWFGVAVPDGLTDFTRPNIFFHPTPGQAGYNDNDYPTKAGLWPTLLETLAESDPGAAALQMIDATIVRAHHRAAGEKGGFRPRRSGGRAAASHRKSMPASTRKVVRSTS